MDLCRNICWYQEVLGIARCIVLSHIGHVRDDHTTSYYPYEAFRLNRTTSPRFKSTGAGDSETGQLQAPTGSCTGTRTTVFSLGNRIWLLPLYDMQLLNGLIAASLLFVTHPPAPPNFPPCP
jgi:hypothetical protein